MAFGGTRAAAAEVKRHHQSDTVLRGDIKIAVAPSDFLQRMTNLCQLNCS